MVKSNDIAIKKYENVANPLVPHRCEAAGSDSLGVDNSLTLSNTCWYSSYEVLYSNGRFSAPPSI